MLRLQKDSQEKMLEMPLKNDQKSSGTQMYLEHISLLVSAVQDHELSLETRVFQAWKGITFLRLWRAYLIDCGLPLNDHLISQQCFTDCEYLVEGLIMSMVYMAEYYPSYEFKPWTYGSDVCEHFFGQVRTFYRGKSNLCVSEIIDIANRITKQNSVMANNNIRDRHGQTKLTKAATQTIKRKYPETDVLKLMIVKQIQEAEKKELILVNSLGMRDKLVEKGKITKNKTL